MRTVAAAAVLVGCGGRAPEPLPAVPPHPRPVTMPYTPPAPLVHVPRPELPEVAALLPDLTEDLRWPLTIMEHPALEPRYPIASVLADPGISWSGLCARGVQNRVDPAHKDELAYLGAWCAAEHHDTAAAVRALAPLRHSGNLSMASAVPFDLIDVLVADVDYAHADQLLAAESVRDPHVWDLLAAAYFEIGKTTDSYEATRTAVQLDPTPLAAVRCRRLARAATLGSEGQRPVFVSELANAAKAKVPDPTCSDLALRVPCALAPAEHCEPYLKSQHMVPWRAALLGVYETWPESGGWSRWMDYAFDVRKAWPADGSEDLINAALEAAVGASSCDAQAIEGISKATYAIAIGIPGLKQKAQWVQTMVVDQRACEEFRDHWVVSHP